MHQVYHKDGGRYRKAAEVDVGNVEGAAIRTAFRVEKWPEYPSIRPEPGEQRPTTFGDIVIDPEGKEYRFEMVMVEGHEEPGFVEVTAIRDQFYEEWLAGQQALNPEIPVPESIEPAITELERSWGQNRSNALDARDFEMPDIPGEGRYEVWHTTDPTAGIAAVRFGEPMPQYPRDYTQIGIVEADGLDRAFELTNSTDVAWIEKPGVVQARLEDADSGTRSTSIGDVIVDPSGTPYRVDKTGFAEIPDAYDRMLEDAMSRARPANDNGRDR